MPYSLLIANDFPPVTSGIATAFGELWRRLPPDRTHILAPRMPCTEAIDAHYPIPIQRIRLPLGETTRAKLGKTAITALHLLIHSLKDRPVRIHCGQVFSSGLAGLLCKRLYGIPYTVWVYGSETVRLTQTGRAAHLMRRILCESEWVIANSNATADEFRAFGVPDARLRRIYPGVDPDRFAPAPPDPARIANLHGKRILLTIARLDQRKGHDMVIRALPRLPDNVVYLIGGKGREEPRLRQLATERNVAHRVHFLGFVPDENLPALYNLCDVFVMPNRITEGTALAGDVEGFGISFIEAGACEKPVIAGRSGGAIEAVLHEQTGLLVDPTSETDIATAISQLLGDPALAQRLGQQARQRILREFDWRILARQVEEIL